MITDILIVIYFTIIITIIGIPALFTPVFSWLYRAVVHNAITRNQPLNAALLVGALAATYTVCMMLNWSLTLIFTGAVFLTGWMVDKRNQALAEAIVNANS